MNEIEQISKKYKGKERAAFLVGVELGVKVSQMEIEKKFEEHALGMEKEYQLLEETEHGKV